MTPRRRFTPWWKFALALSSLTPATSAISLNESSWKRRSSTARRCFGGSSARRASTFRQSSAATSLPVSSVLVNAAMSSSSMGLHPLLAAEVVQREVDSDPEEPGAKRRLTAEGLKLLERLEEGALRDVLGVVVVLDVAADEAAERLVVLARELVERGGVAGSEAIDDCLVLVGARRVAGHARAS